MNTILLSQVYIAPACIVAEQAPKTRVLGTHSTVGEMGLRQVEQDFSSFFAKFLAYLMIFQSAKILKVINYAWQNFGQK